MTERSRTRTDLSRELALSGSVVRDRCAQLGIKLKPGEPFSAEQLQRFYDLHNFLLDPPEGYHRSIKGYRNYKFDSEAGATKDPTVTRDLQRKEDIFHIVINSLEKAELERYSRSFAPLVIRDFLQKSVDLEWTFESDEISSLFNRVDLDNVATFVPVPGFSVDRCESGLWCIRSVVREGQTLGQKLLKMYERDRLVGQANWSGVRLSGELLPEANFRHSNLERAKLISCLLVNATFQSARLEGAELRYCILSSANLNNAMASNLNAEYCTALDSSWNGASLVGALLRHGNFKNSSFKRATLVGADLSGANLAGCNFWLADLSGANLANCDLTGANLTEAVLMDADLSNATIEHTTLKLSDG